MVGLLLEANYFLAGRQGKPERLAVFVGRLPGGYLTRGRGRKRRSQNGRHGRWRRRGRGRGRKARAAGVLAVALDLLLPAPPVAPAPFRDATYSPNGTLTFPTN
jgi:hypothetical protein